MRWLARAFESGGEDSVAAAARKYVIFRERALTHDDDDDDEDEDDDGEQQTNQEGNLGQSTDTPSSWVSSARAAIEQANLSIETAKNHESIAERFHQYARAGLKLEQAMNAASFWWDQSLASWCALRYEHFGLRGKESRHCHLV